jgi:hypothetical protein
MHLLDFVNALVQRAVNGCGDSQGTTNYSTETDEESRERLGAHFAVDDLHRRDVLEAMLVVEIIIGLETYVGEEDTRDTTTSMDTLLVAILRIRTTLETPLVAGDRVLVCLDAALVACINGSAQNLIIFVGTRFRLLPAERQVSSRHYLDKVHVVECLLVRVLVGVVKRVDVVVCPATRSGRKMLLLHVADDSLAQLGTKAQMMDLVGERMSIFVLEVVFKVVHVEVAVGEGLSRGNMEVSDDLVDLDAALQATSLLALLVEVFGIVLSLTLLDALATTERP